MNKLKLSMELLTRPGLAIVSALIVVLSGCATGVQHDMSRVSQNLNDNKLVPRDAVENPDVLNQYRFDYPEPNADLGIYIDFNRANVMAQGGDLYAQLALVSKKAPRQAINFHFLGYDTEFSENKNTVGTLISDIRRQLKRNDTLTFDTNYRFTSDLNARLSKKENAVDDLLAFLLLHATKQNTSQSVKKHFVLILGQHEDLPHKKKQDVADAINLFRARGYTLSVFSYGKEPEFTFIEKLAENGNGQLVILDEFFDASRWYHKEINLVNTKHYRDIKLKVQSMNNVEIISLLSPTDLGYAKHRIDVDIAEMLSNEQRVLMLKAKVPAIKNTSRIGVFRISVNYFDVKKGKYQTIRFSKAINYVMTKNNALPYKNGKLARANHILATHRTIADVAGLIGDKRNIQAIAELTAQSIELRKYINGKQDYELARDARILDKYATNLKKFDNSWMQHWKIWNDLHWDKKRYTASYQ